MLSGKPAFNMSVYLASTLLLLSLSLHAQPGIEISARPPTQPNKIFGENDFIQVKADASNIPKAYVQFVNAFGHINMGCTATHIGRGYVLTAGHCFFAGEKLARDLNCFGVEIEWGVRENLKPFMKSKCEKLMFAQKSKNSNDFAIMKVEPYPEEKILLELNEKPHVGDELTVFSHPDGMPLQWSKSCVVESEQLPLLPALSMPHRCDTNPGSSGAALIDVRSLKIVALHGGGRQHSQSQGMNYATYITSPEVLEALRSLGF